MKSGLMTVGQISRRVGVKVSTIHYYDSIGLISSTRSQSNHRLYNKHVIRRISLVKAAQKMGIELDSIKRAMSHLPDNKTPSKHDWTKLAEYWRTELNSRIQYLSNLRDTLTGCIGCGCLSMESCPIYNKDDTLAEYGPGPVILDKKQHLRKNN